MQCPSTLMQVEPANWVLMNWWDMDITLQKYQHTREFIEKGPLLARAELSMWHLEQLGLEGRSCTGMDLTPTVTVPRCLVHGWKSGPTCPYLPSSRTPGSEPGTAPAGMHGTLWPPLCCLLCWFYTEIFQEKKSIMWYFWRPQQREWRLMDFREKLLAVSPSLTSPSHFITWPFRWHPQMKSGLILGRCWGQQCMWAPS